MAIIRKGKRKGLEVKISQFCNDWFSLEDGSIVTPTMLTFSPKEIEMIEKHRKEEDTGIMFDLYQWEFAHLKRRKSGNIR